MSKELVYFTPFYPGLISSITVDLLKNEEGQCNDELEEQVMEIVETKPLVKNEDEDFDESSSEEEEDSTNEEEVKEVGAWSRDIL